jgi:predicted ATPase
MRRVLAAFVGQRVKVNLGFYTGLLAQLEAETPGAEGALARIDEALALSNEIGHGCSLPFLHRLRGETLLKRDPANPAPAEEAFRTAIAIATEQSARSPVLLASLALAKLLQSTGRSVEAHAVLAPALEGFSPTPEMPEIAEAQALLAALQDIDEVKADVTQRRRMAHLRVAYGNALIATRGAGARETTEAFTHARESASGDRDAPDRLAANWGLWAGSYLRGELVAMRAHAAALVSDVEARPDSPEAGIAHRVKGLTHHFAGEFGKARDHLERALALFQPVRDDDLAFRFGQDAGITAMLHLASTVWPLGEVERAASLIECAQERIASVSHIVTRAHEKLLMAMFELMRGDLSRAAAKAIELAQLSREHDLTMYRPFGMFLEGWATAENKAPGGLEQMRQGVEFLREQNILMFDGIIKIALSEAEARAGDLERAIATLDEALATVERNGYRAFEAELRRARGEMLLRRDPSDFAVAEPALQAAVAVARRQGTRAFELRAAMSLARLYQSTGRLVEAHATLAPALEGFSATPEMPEIAEAQALLEHLAAISAPTADARGADS